MSENNQGLAAQHGVEEYFFRASAADFNKIPGSPLAYWLSTPLQSAFQLGKPIDSISKSVVGLQTGESARFVISWNEVSIVSTRFGMETREDALKAEARWFEPGRYATFPADADGIVPLTGKIQSRIDMLQKDAAAAGSTAARNKLAKEVEKLKKKHVELLAYDEQLCHYADMRITLDLDDGVKVNYGKFGDLLAEVKAVTGGAGDE